MANAIFVRRGSNSIPVETVAIVMNTNLQTVLEIEKNARNNIGDTLDNVLDFMNNRHPDMQPKYKVFKELFVICWAGNAKKVREKMYYSRVDIELINEQVKLFYSALDEVSIAMDDHSFTIVEFVPLGLNDKTSYYPLEEVTIRFFENGYYKIDRKMLFEPPCYNRKMLFHIFNSNLTLLDKLQKKTPLTDRDLRDLQHLPSAMMICYLNGFATAKQQLIDAKSILKPYKSVYTGFKESMRILRKMKYDTPEKPLDN